MSITKNIHRYYFLSLPSAFPLIKMRGFFVSKIMVSCFSVCPTASFFQPDSFFGGNNQNLSKFYNCQLVFFSCPDVAQSTCSSLSLKRNHELRIFPAFERASSTHFSKGDFFLVFVAIPFLKIK